MTAPADSAPGPEGELPACNLLGMYSRKLNRLQRVTLILFIIVVTNWLTVAFTGYSLVGGDLFIIFFLGSLALFILAWFWR